MGHHHGIDTPSFARAVLHHTDQKGPNILTGSVSQKKIDCTVLFTYLLTVSIKRSGLDIWKKSLLNKQYYLFFSNSRSLERPGLIIETLV